MQYFNTIFQNVTFRQQSHLICYTKCKVFSGTGIETFQEILRDGGILVDILIDLQKDTSRSIALNKQFQDAVCDTLVLHPGI